MPLATSYRVVVVDPNKEPVVIDGCKSIERAQQLKSALDSHFASVTIEEITEPVDMLPAWHPKRTDREAGS